MPVFQSKLAWLTPNLGILWILVCSFWLCGSIVANPIIYRLVPRPSRYVIRQFLFRAQPMTWHRTAHLLIQRNKVPSWNYLRISYTWQNIPAKRKENGNSVQSPLSPMSKMAGLVDTSSQCKASFGYCIRNKSFLSYYPALLTVHSFLTDGFIYSALKGSETTGHIDTAINCSSYAKTYKLIYVCRVMLLYW